MSTRVQLPRSIATVISSKPPVSVLLALTAVVPPLKEKVAPLMTAGVGLALVEGERRFPLPGMVAYTTPGDTSSEDE